MGVVVLGGFQVKCCKFPNLRNNFVLKSALFYQYLVQASLFSTSYFIDVALDFTVPGVVISQYIASNELEKIKTKWCFKKFPFRLVCKQTTGDFFVFCCYIINMTSFIDLKFLNSWLLQQITVSLSFILRLMKPTLPKKK